MIKIHKHFDEISNYIEHTIKSMDNYLIYSSDLTTQNVFNNVLREKKQILENLKNKFSFITEYNLKSVKKIQEIGFILKYFYELHDDLVYNEVIMYSLGFNGYIDCLEGLQKILKREK
jgi:nuclear transport factor 2 (NTF2) superfamily protein